MKMPPPEIRPVRTSPMPPVIVQPSMEKSVFTRPLVRAAKMTAARPLPVASMLVTLGPAQMTWMFGTMYRRSGYLPAATWTVAPLMVPAAMRLSASSMAAWMVG